MLRFRRLPGRAHRWVASLVAALGVALPLAALAGDASPAAGVETEVHDESLATLREHLATALKNPDNCAGQIAHARQILAQDENDLPALKAIARCLALDEAHADGEYTSTMREVFEQSKILSMVPELLELGHVKDLVPIMRDIETKQNKSAADYLNLSAFYESLGEPTEQMRVLQNAIAADPDDPRPLLILASKKFDAGDRPGARVLYRQYAEVSWRHPTPATAYLIAYVIALAWPLPTIAVILTLAWGLGVIAIRRERSRLAMIEGQFDDSRIRRILPFIAALLPLILAGRFWTTGKALPFGLLILIVLAEVGALVGPTIYKRVVRPLWMMAKSAVSSLFSARFARYAGLIPTGWRVLIALGAVFVLTTIVPTISIPDLRYGVGLLSFFLFFGTIGSLFVTFLRASQHLRTTMRWTAVSATLPFLLMYLMMRWDELAKPLLRGRPPSSHSIADFWNFLLGWGVAVMVALHLAKILADALLEPLRDMVLKVAAIEKGDFKARVDVVSHDEIGGLGHAVNRMAEGLARREVVERAFRRYHDKSVAERILSGGEGETHIPSKRMPAVVMFSDIRGFTRMSEKMNPEQVVAILNEYFEKMVTVINANNGHIDKFIGDAIMAYWGVPDPDPNAAALAVKTALGMRDEMDKLNVKFLAQGWPKIGVGIGINSGDVVAGSLGSSDRMEYTVIGDVVNTAQRGESNAMAQQILITEPVWKEIGHLLDADALDPRIVKGRTEPVLFWSVNRFKDAVAVSAAEPTKTAQG